MSVAIRRRAAKAEPMEGALRSTVRGLSPVSVNPTALSGWSVGSSLPTGARRQGSAFPGLRGPASCRAMQSSMSVAATASPRPSAATTIPVMLQRPSAHQRGAALATLAEKMPHAGRSGLHAKQVAGRGLRAVSRWAVALLDRPISPALAFHSELQRPPGADAAGMSHIGTEVEFDEGLYSRSFRL